MCITIIIIKIPREYFLIHYLAYFTKYFLEWKWAIELPKQFVWTIWNVALNSLHTPTTSRTKKWTDLIRRSQKTKHANLNPTNNKTYPTGDIDKSIEKHRKRINKYLNSTMRNLEETEKASIFQTEKGRELCICLVLFSFGAFFRPI